MVVKNCDLAKENAIMINEMKSNVIEIKKSVENLTNHYSKRLPLWAVSLITILSSLSVGLIVGIVVRG